eukprot:scaffold3080_cov133-Pinguiococcus_pyrenoidosus.AAC.2
MYGPFPGSWSDAAICNRHPNILSNTPEGFYLFGDSIFRLGDQLLRIERNAQSPAQREFNRRMAKTRVCNENFFSFIWLHEKLTTTRRKNLIQRTRPGRNALVAALLENVRSCIRGHNQISDKFGVPPPELGEYLTALQGI